jgi:hypothetical protein
MMHICRMIYTSGALAKCSDNRKVADRLPTQNPDHYVRNCPYAARPGSFQPIQSQSARPMISSLSAAERNGSSSVNMLTHCR